MNLIQFNFVWMAFNIFLAIVPVLAGWLLYITHTRWLRYVTGVLWLIFLPNSLYLLTDVINLVYQWGRGDNFVKLVFIFQYSILVVFGFFTYILAMYPFELFLKRYHFFAKKNYVPYAIIFLNFIIGFGITLGRVERMNSWDLISDPMLVVRSSANVILSIELLILTVLFGLFGCFIYFLVKKPIVRYVNTYLRQAGVLR